MIAICEIFKKIMFNIFEAKVLLQSLDSMNREGCKRYDLHVYCIEFDLKMMLL